MHDSPFVGASPLAGFSALHSPHLIKTAPSQFRQMRKILAAFSSDLAFLDQNL